MTDAYLFTTHSCYKIRGRRLYTVAGDLVNQIIVIFLYDASKS